MRRTGTAKNSSTLLDRALDGVYIALVADTRQAGCGDLRAVLAHQLDADLGVELPNVARSGPRTFRELFNEARPSLQLLRDVKSFAKQVRARPCGLPSEPYMLLYLASLVAALVRHDRMITRMSRDELLANVYWSLAQSWSDPDLANLFREGIRKLEADRVSRNWSEAQDGADECRRRLP